MPDNFAAGEMDAEQGAPPIEKMGARYGIKVSMPNSRGAHEDLTEPYLMPSVHYRNGNMERVNPSISLTPLGGVMPGPFAIAPAVPGGMVGAQQVPGDEDATEFQMGIGDGYPEGCPVPFRV